MVCVDFCFGTTQALGFASGAIASKSYDTNTGVLTLSNMVKYYGGGSSEGVWIFRASVYLVK